MDLEKQMHYLLKQNIIFFKKRESLGLIYLNDSKAIFEYSNDMDDVYKNFEQYNPNKKKKILIEFDDMVCWYL